MLRLHRRDAVPQKLLGVRDADIAAAMPDTGDRRGDVVKSAARRHREDTLGLVSGQINDEEAAVIGEPDLRIFHPEEGLPDRLKPVNRKIASDRMIGNGAETVLLLRHDAGIPGQRLRPLLRHDFFLHVKCQRPLLEHLRQMLPVRFQKTVRPHRVLKEAAAGLVPVLIVSVFHVDIQHRPHVVQDVLRVDMRRHLQSAFRLDPESPGRVNVERAVLIGRKAEVLERRVRLVGRRIGKPDLEFSRKRLHSCVLEQIAVSGCRVGLHVETAVPADTGKRRRGNVVRIVAAAPSRHDAGVEQSENQPPPRVRTEIMKLQGLAGCHLEHAHLILPADGENRVGHRHRQPPARHADAQHLTPVPLQIVPEAG